MAGDGTSTAQQFDSGEDGHGCTLTDYAAAKLLPEQFLKSLGLSDSRYQGQHAVRIPYYDEAGVEAATRYRTALYKSDQGDDRFKWKVGAKPCPYGLWRLEEAREAGYVVLCEGESDAQTLWYHGIQALGLPGANSWREAWAQRLEGIARIYVVVEPDKGGETVRAWLGKSTIRDRAHIIELGDFKDPSGLYLHSPKTFGDAWKAALESAVAWADLEESRARARASEAWETCHELARTPDILGRFADALAARGVAGESRTARLVYLVMTSRFLERPVSAAVKGPSSAGKSFTVEQTLTFFPASAFYALSAMSERALAYSEEPLKHRILVIYEAAGLTGDFASYLARSLLSEGKVRYETVEKTREGLKPRLIEREGPTGLLVTTTQVSLHPENETRLLSIPVTDTQEQTRRILLALADEGRTANRDAPPAEWVALQEWLEGAEHRVTIPYRVQLAERTPAVSVRLRRDFGMVLNLIRTHAILHQTSRTRDDAGQVVATLEDYAAVYALVADLVSEGVEATVSQTVRETVQAVKELHSTSDSGTVSVAQLAKHLKLDKAAVSRRVRTCIERGYLRNLESGKGKAYKLEPGDDLPEGKQILPLPEELSICHDEDGETDADAEEAEVGKEKECCTVDEVTEGIDTRRMLRVARPDEWVELPSGEPVPGGGVYHFDERTGRTYKQVAFG